MGEQVHGNVVSFNSVNDVHNQRKVLDFISALDIENSMAFLPVTLHHDTFEQGEYVEYIYEYVKDEIDYLLSELVAADPKKFKSLAESLNEQLVRSKYLIRLNFKLSFINSDNTTETEIHELICMWDEPSQSYVVIGYNFNHDSLISIATIDYLDPEFDFSNMDFTVPMS